MVFVLGLALGLVMALNLSEIQGALTFYKTQT
jgi:hypothetical protein